MKKIYLLTAILFISGISFGQYFSNRIINNSPLSDQHLKPNQISKNGLQTHKLSNKKQLDSIVVDLYSGSTANHYAKEYFIYNANGDVVSNISYEYGNQMWKKISKREYVYDANNRTIEQNLYQWNQANSQWIANTKKTITYTSNSYTTEYSHWSTSSNQWIKNEKIEWFQNQSSLDTLSLSYTWNSQWVLNSKNYYSYNTNNDISVQITKFEISGSWVNGRKTEWTYDANNNLIEQNSFQWDSQNNVFTYESKYKKGYDNQNRKIYDVSGGYNNTASTWDYYDSTYHFLGTNSNIDSTKTFSSPPSNVWEAAFKNEMTYNNNYSQADLVLPTTYFSKDDLEYFNHMLEIIVGYDSINGQWPLSYKYSIYYSDFIGSSINIPMQNTISISPNPTQNFFFVDMNVNQQIDIRIYDASGRIIKIQKLNSSTRVNIQDLESGIYFIQVIDANNNVYTSKLIKQ
ncbi:MAG: T9SS type A sorting domain-containing protein [Bacteroidales bacterium]|nr:T9SS type A sorting domain-containing protein [Bacteroidales bacterium]